MADEEQQDDDVEAPETTAALQLTDAIKPLFVSQPQAVIGVTLANLTAMFIVAHAGDSPWNTRALREAILGMHVKMVRELMPVAEQTLMTQMRGRADESSKERAN